jgi:hypothetical protein
MTMWSSSGWVAGFSPNARLLASAKKTLPRIVDSIGAFLEELSEVNEI